jgi:coenzyme F420-reducing hydrogenase beta subunit
VSKSIDAHKRKSLSILNKDIIGYDVHESKPAVYCGYSNDCAIHDRSSSGGICGELVREFLLEGNGVVAGCGYSNDFMSSEYKTVSTLEEYIAKIAGSKYVESDITFIYNAIEKSMKAERKIMAIGCPCQIKQIKDRF